MTKLEVTSDRAQTVDGLGVFEEGVPRQFTREEIEAWCELRGVPFDPDDLPEGLLYTVVVGEA